MWVRFECFNLQEKIVKDSVIKLRTRVVIRTERTKQWISNDPPNKKNVNAVRFTPFGEEKKKT